MVEANYEFERLPDTDGGSTQNLRLSLSVIYISIGIFTNLHFHAGV